MAGGKEDAQEAQKNQIALEQAGAKNRYKITLKPREIEHIIIS